MMLENPGNAGYWESRFFDNLIFLWLPDPRRVSRGRELTATH
jgi:hypothetical protein